ncbi:hypothetical protein [Absidia glauca]|uniref:Aquaporin n=1 Tax=Absidia glauca TaxID=4829 RepID=A0A163JXE1_ABSGL|nr:hypothetical protein [Absidia glauca]
MDPRPTIPRSHHSDSTLTDTSHHSNVVIDIDYLHNHSAHSYYYNSFQRHSDGFSSPRLSICPTAVVSSPPPPPPASSSIYRKLDPEKLKSVTSLVQSCSHSCRSFRYRYRQFFAEFLGTFVMVVLINGVSAEQILDVGSPKSWLTMSFGNGKSFPSPLGAYVPLYLRSSLP